ncbi:hypothetical protein MHYP_G00045670 [Metynnis hypsauchen]
MRRHTHIPRSSVTQLQAVDPDGEPLIFGVVGEEASRFFAVQENTGVVWLRQPLDRETKSEMQVVFSVSDSQGVVKDTVNIQIGDVNDNSPSFHNQPYTVNIPEIFEEEWIWTQVMLVWDFIHPSGLLFKLKKSKRVLFNSAFRVLEDFIIAVVVLPWMSGGGIV